MKTKIKEYLKKIDYKDIIIFLIPLIAFLTVLFVFYPGILSYDSYNQLNQINTGKFESWHPFIHTFIEMICMKIWKTPASVAIFQIIIFSIIWTCICKYNRKNNTKKVFAIQLVVTLIIILNPINSIYSITLWKDILFSYGLLLFCFLMEIIIDKNYEVSNIFVILLGLLMAIISKIRFNGLFVMIIFLIILGIVFFVKKKRKEIIIIILSYLAGMILIIGLEHLYNVENNSKSAINTKIMHIISYYEIEGFLSAKDNKIISKIVDISEMGDNYNVYFSDPIYAISNQEMTIKYRTQLIKIILRESFKHPISFVKYALKSSTMTWSIVRPNDAIGVVMWLNIESVNNEDNIVAIHKEENYYKKSYEFIDNSVNNKVTSTIFYSAALYMYLSLIISILLIIFKKKFKYLLINIPNLLNVLVVAASTPIQDIRYLYPNMLVFYLLTIVLTKEFLNKQSKM
jgi:hypothetical protein